MSFLQQVEPFLNGTEAEALKEYLDGGGWLTEFKKTQELEEEVRNFCGVKFCSITTSGTVALYLALLACDIGEGDLVFVPNYTMIASANVVPWANAKVELIDVNPEDLCMNMKHLEKRLEETKDHPGKRAVMYVSMNGRSGDMNALVALCKSHSVRLIEDTAQAMTSKYNGKFLGTFGDAGVYSFTPHKIVTTGQGGALVTNDEDIYKRFKKLKDFSRTAPGVDHHDGIGFNFKFTDIQAIIGLEQMKSIEFRIRRKKEMIERYEANLQNCPGVTVLKHNTKEVTPWFSEVLLPDLETRDALQGHLKASGIGSRSFYPPLNWQTPYANFVKGSFPVSENLAPRGLWLPSSIGIKDEEIDRCTGTIQSFMEKRK